MDTIDKGVRKFRIALVTMALVFIGFVMCGFKPALANVYSEYCLFLVASAGVFSGSNILEKLGRRPKKSVAPKV